MTIPNYDHEIERHYHPENFAASSDDSQFVLDDTLPDPDIQALLEAGYLNEDAPHQENIL